MKDHQLKYMLIVLVLLIFTPLILISRGNQESPEKATKVYTEETEALLPFDRENGTWEKPSDEELHKTLSSMQYNVTQQEGTEPAFQNEFWDNKEEGIYVDIVSGEPLFSSTDKYDSNTGWPSFTEPIKENAVGYIKDISFGMIRVEAICNTCDGHLGHVFPDGPEPSGLRFCVNSESIKLNKNADV